MYSMPLRGSTRPNVEMIVRPGTPSFCFIRTRPWGWIAGMPCGITTGTSAMPYVPARMSAAASAITTVAVLSLTAELIASRIEGVGSGGTVWSVVTTGFLRVSRNGRR